MDLRRWLKRRWFRARTREVYAYKLERGQRILFDFPGTGPYFSDVVWRVALEPQGIVPSGLRSRSIVITFRSTPGWLIMLYDEKVRVRG